MRLVRLGLAAVLASSALTAFGASPASALGSCSASVSVVTHATGELTASVTATVNGDCPVGHRDEIGCQIVLVGPLGVVKTSSGGGVATEGCQYGNSVTMSNGVQGGAYAAVGIVTYGDFLPGVAADAAVA